MKKSTSFLLISILFLSFFGARQPAQASALAAPEIRVLNLSANKIEPALQSRLAALQAGEMVTVIVTMRQQADLRNIIGKTKASRRKAVIRALQLLANSDQRPLRTLLATRQGESKVDQFTRLWITNGLSVTASADVIQELSSRPDVASISPDTIDIVPSTQLAAAAAEQNLSVINVPAVWNLGYFGQGVVVANMDSGVDASHPALAGAWRGGSNSWFDPYNQHPTTPTDLTGHGTWTMGVMVGNDSGGTSIGVAPQAKWIAVKIFNDAGSATATAIHLGFQWLLDPDGDPNTADAPDVVNNSWAFGTPGCNLEFQPDLQTLRAAGILPVFAAGNYGPGGSTSVSPANYPEAFAVGATTNLDRIYGSSSRGPSACGETQSIYPEIVAPGVNINSSDLFGFYSQNSGTSLSAPHVAGALALLLSAYPNLDAAQQSTALINSAADLGTAGPDNTFGYGRLNVLAAYQLLGGGQANPTATPVIPTATNLPLPTATNTPLPTATSTATNLPLPTSTSTPLPTATSTAIPTATATNPPPPTATPTNPPTATATATLVPANTLHIGDLDRLSTLSGSKWNATVTITVHNAGEQPLANAKVSASWSNGTTGSVSCTTNTSGTCQVSKTGLPLTSLSVKLTVTNVTRASFTYTSAANHDPDGDSNGAFITVSRP